MNLFNCFQAMAFYTAMPFGIEWCFTNDHTGWGYILAGVEFIGFVMASMAIKESAMLK